MEHSNIEPRVRTRRFWILRFWRTLDDKVHYAVAKHYHREKRTWFSTLVRSEATEFSYKSDARGGIKRKAFEELLKPGHDLVSCDGLGVYREIPGSQYFWEVVEVTETITTTSEEEVSVSNAPAMVQIARAAS